MSTDKPLFFRRELIEEAQTGRYSAVSFLIERNPPGWVLGVRRKLKARGRLIRVTLIDGLPGYISEERDGVLQTTAFVIEDGLIRQVMITRNPDKLALVARLVGTPPREGLPH